jgi:hypothetical protein
VRGGKRQGASKIEIGPYLSVGRLGMLLDPRASSDSGSPSIRNHLRDFPRFGIGLLSYKSSIVVVALGRSRPRTWIEQDINGYDRLIPDESRCPFFFPLL